MLNAVFFSDGKKSKLLYKRERKLKNIWSEQRVLIAKSKSTALENSLIPVPCQRVDSYDAINLKDSCKSQNNISDEEMDLYSGYMNKHQ